MYIQKPETIRGEIHTLKIQNVSRISELGCLTDEYNRCVSHLRRLSLLNTRHSILLHSRRNDASKSNNHSKDSRELTLINRHTFVCNHYSTEELSQVGWPMGRNVRFAALHNGLAVLLNVDQGAYALEIFLLDPNGSIKRIVPPHISLESFRNMTAISLDHEFLYLAFKSPRRICLWARSDLKPVSVIGCDKNTMSHFLEAQSGVKLAFTLVCDANTKNQSSKINDIVIRKDRITALSADGTVTEWQKDKPGEDVEIEIRPSKVFLAEEGMAAPEDGFNTISRSQDLMKIIIADRMYCEKSIHLQSSGARKTITARGEVSCDESFLRISEECNTVALGIIPRYYKNPITPVFKIHSVPPEYPTKTIAPFGDSFQPIIGTFQDIILDETSIIYFGTDGVMKLDRLSNLEKQPHVPVIRSTTSRYIPLNIGLWRTMSRILSEELTV